MANCSQHLAYPLPCGKGRCDTKVHVAKSIFHHSSKTLSPHHSQGHLVGWHPAFLAKSNDPDKLSPPPACPIVPLSAMTGGWSYRESPGSLPGVPTAPYAPTPATKKSAIPLSLRMASPTIAAPSAYPAGAQKHRHPNAIPCNPSSGFPTSRRPTIRWFCQIGIVQPRGVWFLC